MHDIFFHVSFFKNLFVYTLKKYSVSLCMSLCEYVRVGYTASATCKSANHLQNCATSVQVLAWHWSSVPQELLYYTYYRGSKPSSALGRSRLLQHVVLALAALVLLAQQSAGNSLPLSLRNAQSLGQFKRQLNQHLFRTAYD